MELDFELVCCKKKKSSTRFRIDKHGVALMMMTMLMMIDRRCDRRE